MTNWVLIYPKYIKSTYKYIWKRQKPQYKSGQKTWKDKWNIYRANNISKYISYHKKSKMWVKCDNHLPIILAKVEILMISNTGKSKEKQVSPDIVGVIFV